MQGNRRSFFRRTGVAAALGLGWPAPLLSHAAARPGLRKGRPHHIIHLVADGTSSGTLTLGDQFARLARGRGLRWLELYRQEGSRAGLVNMRSLNSLVTDSAAASSSWGSGSRVINGVLNQLPDGRDLRPLYTLFDEAGWKQGLVTTTEITHATPAGFVANASSRATADDIARQYLVREVDILLGGGAKFFDPARRQDKRDLRDEFRRAGYAVMDHAAALHAAPTGPRWLGVFASGHLPLTLDHQNDPALAQQVPTLAQMTRRALQWLERSPHFILQVEGGRVDHAAHACDIAAAVREVVAFDEAIEVCLDFQRRIPDTLLVITTDHGTGNPGLNGTGAIYKDTIPLFANVLRAQRSFEHMQTDVAKIATVESAQDLLKQATGYAMPEAKAVAFLPFIEKRGKTLYDTMNSLSAQLGQVMANYYGVGWASGNHTSDYVPVLACGPGADAFAGFLQNTDVFHHYLQLAGIDYRNPEAPLLAEQEPSAARAELEGLA